MIFGTPQIITDGLVLHLDAANAKSYPRSGTTWNDLSGNRNDGTLTNGPIFNSDNGGNISFDGTNDLVTLPPSNLWDFGTNDLTIEWWFLRTGTPQLYGRYIQFANGDVFGPISIAVKNNLADTVSVSVSSNGTSWNLINDISAGTLLTNRWNYCVLSRVGSSFVFYVNTIGTSIGTSASSLFYASGGVPVIGGQSVGTARTINGRIALMKIYKGKGFTLNDVIFHYNAIKSRFNL